MQPEIMMGAAPFLFHQTGGLQHLKMLGNRGTADRKPAGQFANRGGPPPQQMEHRLASRIGKGCQHLSLVGHALP